jgi:hypothetical protein
MPADADARAKQDADNCTKGVGPQLRCIHGRSLSVRSWAVWQNALNQTTVEAVAVKLIRARNAQDPRAPGGSIGHH